MTTNVTITACCSEDKEVVVDVLDGDEKSQYVLQNGESATHYAYDDREIFVKERKRSSE